jgi:RND superfamily putative drug exporter
VITAAAAMLAVVFLAFASSQIFFMKQAAVGQAVGVLLDATIVRALLVPSLMALLGDVNWWAPAPLKRFQERYGFREGPGAEDAAAGAQVAATAPVASRMTIRPPSSTR